MKLRPLALALAAGFLATGAGVARAQQPDTGKAALSSVLRTAAEANRMVRFRSVAGEEWRGRVGGVSETTARVGGRIIPLENQRQLEVRFEHPDPVWDGTVIGAGVATAILYAPFASFVRFAEERPLTVRDRVGIVCATALMGGMVGLLVDEARQPPPDWHVMWRRTTDDTGETPP